MTSLDGNGRIKAVIDRLSPAFGIHCLLGSDVPARCEWVSMFGDGHLTGEVSRDKEGKSGEEGFNNAYSGHQWSLTLQF